MVPSEISSSPLSARKFGGRKVDFRFAGMDGDDGTNSKASFRGKGVGNLQYLIIEAVSYFHGIGNLHLFCYVNRNKALYNTKEINAPRTLTSIGLSVFARLQRSALSRDLFLDIISCNHPRYS